MTCCNLLLCMSKRIESTAQIARKLHKSISILVAYMINDTYLLSGDMQYKCFCGLSIKYASSACRILYICSKAFSLNSGGKCLRNSLSWLVTCKQPTFSGGMHTSSETNAVMTDLPMTIVGSVINGCIKWFIVRLIWSVLYGICLFDIILCCHWWLFIIFLRDDFQLIVISNVMFCIHFTIHAGVMIN